MRPAALLLLVVMLGAMAAGCGSTARRSAPPATTHVLARRAARCAAGAVRPLVTARRAYAGVAPDGAVARARPGGGGAVVARFGPTNVNDYPTVLGVLGAVVGRDCSPAWYRVELPVRPNGATGYVRASSLQLAEVRVRIVVSVAKRRLTVLREGRPVLRATVAVGSPSTPTPTGRFYVNQRLIPTEADGPYGPGAIGISAYSNVLTGWAQGGPVAIHGTNEPWSIGHAVSNGCIRLPNPTLRRVFRLAVAGTPVIILP